MSTLRTLFFPALIGLSISATACMDAGEPEAEVASDLAVSNWQPGIGLPSSWRGAQVATLNGVSYAVYTGECGGRGCFPDTDTTGLRWSATNASGTWVYKGTIPGQASNSKVSLAAFNGFLYMVHTGGSDSSATWISRLDPATEQWSSNYQIPYASFAGPPAIAAYNNLLYFIGTRPFPYDMWYATMNTGEGFSAQVAIPGHDSASRPSAAAFKGKLYIAHRWGQTGDVVYGTFDGSAWSNALHIPDGTGGALRGLDPVIAADNGTLHLVHTRPEGTPYVWWSYTDGCTWAGTEVTIDTQQSALPPSLTQGGPGLYMVAAARSSDLTGLLSYTMTVRPYAHPITRFPPNLPCDLPVITVTP